MITSLEARIVPNYYPPHISNFIDFRKISLNHFFFNLLKMSLLLGISTLSFKIYYYLISTKVSHDHSSIYKGPTARVGPTSARANSNRYGSGIVRDLLPACEIVPSGSRHFREAKRCRRGAAKQIERHEQQIIINTFVVDRYRPRRFPPAPLIDSQRARRVS